MFAIVRAYFDITMLRQGPQYLPASAALLILTLLVNTALQMLLVPLQNVGVLPIALDHVVATTMLLSLVWLLLNSMQMPERFLQCTTALFGADIVFISAELMVYALAPDTIQSVIDQRPNAGALVLLIILVWRTTVFSHILRKAMSVTVLQSLGLIAVFYLLYIGALTYLASWLGLGKG